MPDILLDTFFWVLVGIGVALLIVLAVLIFKRDKKTMVAKEEPKKVERKEEKKEEEKPVKAEVKPAEAEATTTKPETVKAEKKAEPAPKKVEKKATPAPKKEEVKPAPAAPKKERQTNYHVVLKGDKWQVKRENAAKALKNFDTQQEAIDYAKEKAENQGNQVVIHKTDGKIRKQNYNQ